MISHTLIQLDNQREKPTQVSTKRGLGRCRAPGGHRSPRGGREFCPLSAKNDGSPKVGEQGSAPVPWNATQRPPVPSPEPQGHVAPPKRSRTLKRARPPRSPRGLGDVAGQGVPPRVQLRRQAQGAASLPAPNSPPDPARSPLPLDNYWKLLARNC